MSRIYSFFMLFQMMSFIFVIQNSSQGSEPETCHAGEKRIIIMKMPNIML